MKFRSYFVHSRSRSISLGALACAALSGACASRGSVNAGATAPTVAIAEPREVERPADLIGDAELARVASIHRSKCGACHTPVEPGSLTHSVAQSAMQRHRRRAKLSERDWAEMVQYLSSDGALHARPTARVP